MGLLHACLTACWLATPAPSLCSLFLGTCLACDLPYTMLPQTSRTLTEVRTAVYWCLAVAVAVFIVETSVGKQKLVAKGPRLGLCL